MEADDALENHEARFQSAGERLVEMLVGGELERIARSLERTVGALPDDADDAVLDAVGRTLGLDVPPDPSAVGAFVLRTAQNRVRDGQRRRKQFDKNASVLYQDPEGDDLAEHVIAEDVFRRIRAVVQGWDNANVRAVTTAFLDAVYDGEELGYNELAERASAARGEELSPDSVRVWKSRGVRRLRTELIDQPDQERTP